MPRPMSVLRTCPEPTPVASEKLRIVQGSWTVIISRRGAAVLEPCLRTKVLGRRTGATSRSSSPSGVSAVLARARVLRDFCRSKRAAAIPAMLRSTSSSTTPSGRRRLVPLPLSGVSVAASASGGLTPFFRSRSPGAALCGFSWPLAKCSLVSSSSGAFWPARWPAIALGVSRISGFWALTSAPFGAAGGFLTAGIWANLMTGSRFFRGDFGAAPASFLSSPRRLMILGSLLSAQRSSRGGSRLASSGGGAGSSTWTGSDSS